MTQKKIPMRPPGKYSLSPYECDCLTWYVLKGCNKVDAFAVFCRPDLVAQKSLLKSEAKQFFASASAIAYITAYTRLLEATLNEDFEQPKEVIDDKELDNQLQETLKQLVAWAMSQSTNIDHLDKDTAALVLKILDNIGLFDSLEKAEEKPRRYLPVRCQSECQYRLFVESNITGGKIVNECDYCRARRFAEDNGFIYDATKNLDIPVEILQKNDLENYKIIDNED
jgi:hypothetical protein